MLSDKLKTIRSMIPAEPGNKIGMDTGNRKNWLHFWISEPRDESNPDKPRKLISVHLTREDAQNLVDEINERLF